MPISGVGGSSHHIAQAHSVRQSQPKAAEEAAESPKQAAAEQHSGKVDVRA